MKLFLTMVVLSWSMAAYTLSTDEASFLEAARRGDVEQLKSLISSVNVDVQNEKGETALMLAAQEGHIGTEVAADWRQSGTYMREAAVIRHTGVMVMLIEARAGVNFQDDKGRTALMLAAEGGHAEAVKLLITKGASVKAQDEYGRTVLMYAYVRGGGYIEIAEMLQAAEVATRATAEVATGVTARVTAGVTAGVAACRRVVHQLGRRLITN